MNVSIAVAPNGATRSKADHPAIPLTSCELAGAAMIHMHVREPDGSHLLDADAYRDATAAVRRAVGDRPVVQIPARRSAPIGRRNRWSSSSDLLPPPAPYMPHLAHWSVCAFGRNEAACVTTAAALGGHVRVGFENNIWNPGGTLVGSNVDLVASAAAALDLVGLPFQDANGLRRELAALAG